MTLHRHGMLLLIIAGGWGLSSPAMAQSRVRLPADLPPSLSTSPPSLLPVPNASPGLPAWPPPPSPLSSPGTGAVLVPQIQPFDPYSGGGTTFPGAAPRFPTLIPPNMGPLQPPLQPNGSLNPPGIVLPPNVFQPGLPTTTVPPTTAFPPSSWPNPPASPYALPPAALPPAVNPPAFPPAGTPPAFGQPTYPPYPTAPPTSPLFPNGLGWGETVGPGNRLFQDTGGIYTYLHGNDGDQVQLHEVELFTSMLFKYFAHSAADLRVSPGFVFDFLDGPQDVPADLPAQLYGAYLNALWRPQLSPQLSADLNARVGVYSDFQTFTTHAIRITGYGLGKVQLTPTLILKAGIEYLDRAKIKLLPAGGFQWEPDPQTIVDIYFPRPKFSKYWSTWGNTDVWWHLGAEYGGGSWIIERPDAPLMGVTDRVDLNDIRVYWGVEWDRLSGFDGLFQVGYVFDREVIYKEVPTESLGLDDTFMIRLGVQF